jgi:ribosomal protein S3
MYNKKQKLQEIIYSAKPDIIIGMGGSNQLEKKTSTFPNTSLLLPM